MGKGARGQQQADIKKYGDPAYNASTGMAGQARNMYYGTPSSGAVPRSGSPTGNTDYQSIVHGLLQGKPLNTETLKAIEPQLAQYGMKYIWNADGTRPDIILPDGQQIDFVTNLGGAPGTQELAWIPQHRGYSGPGGIAGGAISDYGDIRNQYQQFANTGGYSPEDLANIRARSVSPIRSVYSSARRDIDRQRALQGGYSPNRTAALAKMAREQSYATSDASTNVEAAIAQMVQQGKLAGLGGMAGLYGTTPGLANMFGNQALQSQGMQNQMGLGMMGAQQQARQLPTGFQSFMDNLSKGAAMAAPFINPTTGLFTNPFGKPGGGVQPPMGAG